jgi:RNA polymerase sigma factor (sigma-70 family)
MTGGGQPGEATERHDATRGFCSRPEESGASSAAELVASHAKEIRRFAASKFGRGADADDVAQQTLLAGCANIATLRSENPRAWLFAIARRLLVDLYRDRDRTCLLPIDDEQLSREEPALQTSPTLVQSHCAAHERLLCCLEPLRCSVLAWHLPRVPREALPGPVR